MQVTNISSKRLILKFANNAVLQPGASIEVPNLKLETHSQEITSLVDSNQINLTDFGNRPRFITNDSDDDANQGGGGGPGGGLEYESRTFSPTNILFDKNVTYNDFTQIGTLSLTLAPSGHSNGAVHFLKITGNGSTISFSADFVDSEDAASGVGPLSFSETRYYQFSYNEALGKVVFSDWQPQDTSALETDISTNTSNISTNVTSIVNLDSRVTVLESSPSGTPIGYPLGLRNCQLYRFNDTTLGIGPMLGTDGIVYLNGTSYNFHTSSDLFTSFGTFGVLMSGGGLSNNTQYTVWFSLTSTLAAPSGTPFLGLDSVATVPDDQGRHPTFPEHYFVGTAHTAASAELREEYQVFSLFESRMFDKHTNGAINISSGLTVGNMRTVENAILNIPLFPGANVDIFYKTSLTKTSSGNLYTVLEGLDNHDPQIVLPMVGGVAHEVSYHLNHTSRKFTRFTPQWRFRVASSSDSYTTSGFRRVQLVYKSNGYYGRQITGPI